MKSKNHAQGRIDDTFSCLAPRFETAGDGHDQMEKGHRRHWGASNKTKKHRNIAQYDAAARSWYKTAHTTVSALPIDAASDDVFVVVDVPTNLFLGTNCEVSCSQQGDPYDNVAALLEGDRRDIAQAHGRLLCRCTKRSS